MAVLTEVMLVPAEVLAVRVSEGKGVEESVESPVKDNAPLIVPPPIPGELVMVSNEVGVEKGVPLTSPLPVPPTPPLDEVSVGRRGESEKVEEDVAATSVKEG